MTGPDTRLADVMAFGLPTTAGSKSALPVFKGKGDSKTWVRNVIVDGHASASAKERRASWRSTVQAAAEVAMSQRNGAPDIFPLVGPLAVHMVFTMPRPAGHYRTSRGQRTRQVRDTAPPAPAVTPDLTKLARAVEDCLTSAGLWRDDAQVVAYKWLAKVYTGMPDAMPRPGVRVIVWAAWSGSPDMERLTQQEALPL